MTRGLPIFKNLTKHLVEHKIKKNGTPGPIRTGDLLIRSQILYPAELRAHKLKEPIYQGFCKISSFFVFGNFQKF